MRDSPVPLDERLVRLSERQRQVHDAFWSLLKAVLPCGAPGIAAFLKLSHGSVKTPMQYLTLTGLIPCRPVAETHIPKTWTPAFLSTFPGYALSVGQPAPSTVLAGLDASMEGLSGGPVESYEEAANAANLVKHTSRQVRNDQELIAETEIDTIVWQVEWWKSKKWDTPMKLRQPDGSHVAVVTTQWYVEARLIRRVGRQVSTDYPPLQACHITLSAPPRPKVRAAPFSSALIVPDPHVGYLRSGQSGTLDPFHDRRMLSLALVLAEELNPKVTVVLGDLLDLPDWSDKFLKSPEFYHTFQPTIYEAGWWLAQFRQRSKRVVWIPGNHDQRILKAVWAYMPQVYGLKPANTPDPLPVLSLENLLGLRNIDVELAEDYPAGKVWLNDGLAFEHGKDVSNKPGGSVGKVLDRGRRFSSGMGHNHREETASRTVASRQGPVTVSSYSFGTCARLDGPIPSRDTERNWQNTLGVVWYDDRDHQTEMIRVNHGTCIWHGKRLAGADVRKALSKDTGWSYL